jgi:hypothetical protein
MHRGFFGLVNDLYSPTLSSTLCTRIHVLPLCALLRRHSITSAIMFLANMHGRFVLHVIVSGLQMLGLPVGGCQWVQVLCITVCSALPDVEVEPCNI